MLYCCSGFPAGSSGSGARQYAIVSISSSAAMMPSVWHRPTASSKSLPGVRIATATGTGSCPGPWTRISIGSSVARRSRRSRDLLAVDREHSRARYRAAHDRFGTHREIRLHDPMVRAQVRPSRSRSAGVSTSANARAGTTAPHCSSVRYSQSDTGDGAQRRHAAAHGRGSFRDRGRAVARARVLESSVDDRHDGLPAGPFDQQPEHCRLDEREVAAEQHDRAWIAQRADPREQGDQRSRAARFLLDRGQTTHAGPDLDHRIAHRPEDARAARRERLALDDEPRLVGPHPAAAAAREQHAGHLAHRGLRGPVVVPSRSGVGLAGGSQRVADDRPSVGAPFEQHVVAHARALGRYPRDDERALSSVHEGVDVDVFRQPPVRLVRGTRRASPR